MPDELPASPVRVFLAHAESEKKFVSRVKDAIEVLSRSRLVRRLEAGPRLPPTVFFDKDTFSNGRDASLRTFAEAAAAAAVFVLFVPADGFHSRSFVARELFAFLTGQCHDSRSTPYPGSLTEAEALRSRDRMPFVLIVDRHGVVSWPDPTSGPTALPEVCRSGLLASYFAAERPRLREASTAVEEVAAAVLASAWSVEPSAVRSRVALRRRSIYLGVLSIGVVVAVVLSAVAIYALRQRSIAEQRSRESLRALARVRELVVSDATSLAAKALSERDSPVTVRELLKILEAAEKSDPIRAAAMTALLREIQAMPRSRGHIGPISGGALSPGGTVAVVRTLDGTVAVYDTSVGVVRVTAPKLGTLSSELMRVNFLPSPRGMHGDIPHFSPDGAYVALVTTEGDMLNSEHRVTWRVTAWRIGSDEPLVDLPFPDEPSLRWTHGLVLLAKVWSPDPAASGDTVYGWRFADGRVHPPFQLWDRRPFEFVDVSGDKVGVIRGVETTEPVDLVDVTSLDDGVDYRKREIPASAISKLSKQERTALHSLNTGFQIFSSSSPFRRAKTTGHGFVEVLPTSTNNYYATRQALTYRFFDTIKLGNWHQGATPNHLIGILGKVVEADLDRQRFISGSKFDTSADVTITADRSHVLILTSAGNLLEVPTLLNSALIPVLSPPVKTVERSWHTPFALRESPNRVPRTASACDAKYDNRWRLPGTDGRMAALTADGYAVLSSTCEIQRTLAATDLDKRVLALIFDSAASFRIEGDAIIATIGAVTWRIGQRDDPALPSSIRVSAGDRPLAFPESAGSYVGVSDDGLRLLTAWGGSDYQPNCYEVWFLGSAPPIRIVTPVCYSMYTRAEILGNGSLLRIEDDHGHWARLDIGPVEAQPWTWATSDALNWMLAPLLRDTVSGDEPGLRTELLMQLRRAPASDRAAKRMLEALSRWQ